MKGKLNKFRNEKKLNDKNNPKSLKLKSINKITKQLEPTITNNKNLDYQINLDNIYNEDTEYEIDSYSKNVTESQRDTKHNLYIGQLESKIQEQAHRLNYLTKYKNLCEQRLLELNPNEKFPLTEKIKSKVKNSSLENNNTISKIENNENNINKEIKSNNIKNINKEIKSNNINNINKENKTNNINNINKENKTNKLSNINKESKINKDNIINEERKLNKMNDINIEKKENNISLINNISNTINEDNNNENIILKKNNNDNLNNDDDYSEGKSIYIEKYKKLKEKYKNLQKENEQLKGMVQQNEIDLEQQKNTILTLKETIDTDYIKNGTINKYITSDNLIDFVQLKNESEEYRKKLVLSQALFNSLKSDLELVNNENNNFNTNSDLNKNFDKINSFNYQNNNDNNSIINNNDLINENYNLKNTINNQNKKISDLLKNNCELQSFLNEASYKLNEGINLNNNAKQIFKNLNAQINDKDNRLRIYDEKFTYFNDYISKMKNLISQLQNFLNNYIILLINISNEDKNSLLSKNFQDNMLIIKNSIDEIPQIEKYNLDPEIDLNIIQNLLNIFTSVNKEFLNIFIKMYQFNYPNNSMRLDKIKNDLNFEVNKLNDFLQNSILENPNNDFFRKNINVSNLNLSNNNYIENENSNIKEEKFQKFLDNHSYLSLRNSFPSNQKKLTYQVINTNQY